MEQRITAPKGCKIESVEHDENSVVIMFSEDKPKFKKGDFLKSTITKTMVIYKEEEEFGTFESYFNNNHSGNFLWCYDSFKVCTEQEKHEMLDYMHSNGKDWDEDNMEVIPYVWEPKAGEKYWCISNNLKVCLSFYNPESKSCFDYLRNNNCFKPEAIAPKYSEELKRILNERKL